MQNSTASPNPKTYKQSELKMVSVLIILEIGPKKSSDIQKVVIHKSTRGRAE